MIFLFYLLAALVGSLQAQGHGLVFPQSNCNVRCENGGMCAFSFSDASLHSCICLMGVYEGDRCQYQIGENPNKKLTTATPPTVPPRPVERDSVAEQRRREEERQNAERRRQYEIKIKQQEEQRRAEQARLQQQQQQQQRESVRPAESDRQAEMARREEENKRREEDRRRMEEDRRREMARREEERQREDERRRQQEQDRQTTERARADERRRQHEEAERAREDERRREQEEKEQERVREEERRRQEEAAAVPEDESGELDDGDMEPEHPEGEEWDYRSDEVEQPQEHVDLNEIHEETQGGWDQASVSEDPSTQEAEAATVTSSSDTSSTSNALGPIGKIIEDAAAKTLLEHEIESEEEAPMGDDHDDYWDHHPKKEDDYEIPKVIDLEEEEEIKRDRMNPQDNDDQVREFAAEASEDDGWSMVKRADYQESSGFRLSSFLSTATLIITIFL